LPTDWNSGIIDSTKNEKDAKMNMLEFQLPRADILELLLEHAENQGLTSYRYMMKLAAMTDNELDAELTRLEELAP
jgi:hypothetical protein